MRKETVVKLIERKLDLLRSWGVDVRREENRWSVGTDIDIVRLDDKFIDIIAGSGGLREDYLISDCKKAIDRAIEATVMYLLTCQLGGRVIQRNGKFMFIQFNLQSNSWVFRVVDLDGNEVASISGKRTESPLKFSPTIKALIIAL